jgi:hypothetical protein
MPKPDHTPLQSRVIDETGVRAPGQPRTLLDALIDRIQAGQETNIVIVEPACRYPFYAPSTAYSWGCRCPECRDAHTHAVHPRRSRHHLRDITAAKQRHPSRPR